MLRTCTRTRTCTCQRVPVTPPCRSLHTDMQKATDVRPASEPCWCHELYVAVLQQPLKVQAQQRIKSAVLAGRRQGSAFRLLASVQSAITSLGKLAFMPGCAQVRAPMLPTHVFLIDVSYHAMSCGATAAACSAVADCLDAIQGEFGCLPQCVKVNEKQGFSTKLHMRCNMPACDVPVIVHHRRGSETAAAAHRR